MTTTTGVPIGAAEMPWGTHAAYVYSDTSEIEGTVVPYLAVGLAGRERCIWVTWLARSDAERILRAALPDFDRCMRSRQLEILDAHEVYAVLEPESLIARWLAIVRSARVAGFSGVRIVGDAHPVLPKELAALIEYERCITTVVRSHHIRVLCGYCLADCARLAQASATHDWLLASGALLQSTANGTLQSELSVALGMASHEIRMPLQILSLGVETGMVAPDPTTRDRMRRAVRNLERIASDLEEVARLSDRATALSVAEVDLCEVCRRVVADFLELYPARRILVGAALPVHGLWDERRLAQLTVDLIANAIRYGKDPISIAVGIADGDAVLEVADAGRTLPPGEPARLAAPFRGLGGQGELGLGLLVVREIARAHGGGVETASQDGRFTTVRVRLPRSRPSSI